MRVSILRLGAGLTALAVMLGSPARAAEPKSAEGEKLFAVKVWPLLKAKCLACHGDDPKKLRGGLDLTTQAAALQGGDRGKPAIVFGKPNDSLLYVAVTRKNPDLAMPPKQTDKLSADEVETIRRWIAGGAPWPSAERVRELAKVPGNVKDGVTVATSGGLSPEWTNRRYRPADLWAYQPLKKPATPQARRLAWGLGTHHSLLTTHRLMRSSPQSWPHLASSRPRLPTGRHSSDGLLSI